MIYTQPNDISYNMIDKSTWST